jgi:hydroxyacylglutathione hydrolase
MERYPMLNIHPIAAFSDNYIWLIYDPSSRQAFVVDPGDAQPVLDALQTFQLELAGILITHHHFDHVGGVLELCDHYKPVVYGPHNPAINGITRRLAAGDRLDALGMSLEVLEVPGHTLDHIAYVHRGDSPLVFCGDTLFAGGCGRLFEGNPSMMLRSLQSLAALPPSTRVYCAHEYTLGNLAFARAVEPDNAALAQRSAVAADMRQRGEPTVPSDMALELATNPFLRCNVAQLQGSLRRQGKLDGDSTVEVFTLVRGWKDSF